MKTINPEWVVKERIDGQFISYFFKDCSLAHNFFRKKIRAGKNVICIRSAQ